jgi:hypothetical protein
MSKSQPKLIEVSINASAGGKVAIEEYAKIASDYTVNMSRRFQIPEDWTVEEAKEFHLKERAELRAIVDKMADEEFEERFGQSYLSNYRDR